MRFAILILSIGLLLGRAVAEQPKAIFGAHEYIEYLPGSLPIVIGAPHGGSLKPRELPDREEGKTMQDAFTQELARTIRESMIGRFGAAPALVICRLHRSKLDCNREVNEATQGSPGARQAFDDFHSFINQACDAVGKQAGAGLYIDLHGHRHEQELVEVGALVRAEKLAMSDAELDAGDFIPRQSSIRELDKRSPESFSALLRGPRSLGGLLEARGFAAIPSPAHPAPGNNPYFNGAYSVAAHGSRDKGTISAIQIECPFKAVREKPESRAKFSATLCDALEEYFRVHFQMDLKEGRRIEGKAVIRPASPH